MSCKVRGFGAGLGFRAGGFGVYRLRPLSLRSQLCIVALSSH